MRKSDVVPMPEYFDRYINLTDDVSVVEAIQISLEEIPTFPMERWEALGDYRYAPGKWSIKQILQHLLDTERIFMYRALCFARGESSPLPSFDEEGYAHNASVAHRSISNLVQEMQLSRRSLLALYESFTPEMLQKTGMGFRGEYSVLAIGFILAGHQRWHLNIIKQRYL